MDFAELADPEFWRQLLSSDFNRGYAAAIGLVFALLLLLLILKIIFKLLFRTRRCGAIPVRCPTGDLLVSRGAIENAARQVLDEFPQLAVRRIMLYRNGKRFSMTLCCSFSADGRGLPAISDEIKPKMLQMLHRVFGIDTLQTIRFQIEALTSEIALEDAPAPAKPAEKTPDNAVIPGL